MSTSTDALDHTRAEAQALHKQLEEGRRRVRRRSAPNLQAVTGQTQTPAHSLKAHAVAERRSEMAMAKS